MHKVSELRPDSPPIARIPGFLHLEVLLKKPVRLEMEREGTSKEAALPILQKDGEERIKWSKSLYGIDTRKASLYDLVLRIHKLSVKNTVDIICHAAKLEQFQTTHESQQTIDDLALAAQMKGALVDVKRDLQVSAKNGTVFVKTEARRGNEEALAQKIREISKSIADVKDVKIDISGLPTWMSGGGGELD